jgi:hypothetical protein
VERILLGHDQGRQPDVRAEQRLQPGAGGHDHNPRLPGPVGRVHGRARVVRLHPQHPGAVMELRAPRGGDRPHRRHRALRVKYPAVGVEQDPIRSERHAGPALSGRRRRDQLRGHCERGQDVIHLLLCASRAEVDGAGGQDQFLRRLIGELSPPPLRLAGQPHVERIRIRAPENPGAAVRAAPPVAGLERLDDGHRATPARQGPGRGRPGEPGSDDDDIHAFGAHGLTVTTAVNPATRGAG